MKNSDTLRAAVAEREKRNRLIQRLREPSFPKQLAVIDDPTRLKSVLCTRRAGKTNGAAIGFLEQVIENPGCNLLFCALTTKSALAIIWKDVLAPMAKIIGLKAVLKKHDNLIKFSNGTELVYFGINSSKDEREKALGRKYKRVIIDESASITIDLKEFVFRHILPALADEQGDLWLIGTPSDNTKSYFYRVTVGEEAGFSHHHWSAADNPYMSEIWAKEIQFLIDTIPDIETTPWFIQNYLGRWAVDDTKRVYKYKSDRNSIDALPNDNRWKYVLGVDLGHSPDPSSFVVSAYRPYDPKLYFVHSYKRTEMIISDVVEYIKMLMTQFTFESMVIDNANKQAVEEMKVKHNLPLIAADKAGKADFISIMNDDFHLGRIVAVAGQCESLIDEWLSHIWDERAREKGKFVESPQTANHCCDGALYNWRHCYHWIDRGVEQVRAPSDAQQIQQHWDDKADELQRQSELEHWEDDSIW